MKEAHLKKLHTVWFQLDGILENAKISGCLGLVGKEERMNKQVTGNCSDSGTILYGTLVVNTWYYS